ncbi:UNVERIFIED_CONTAM: hypothetical protein HDU68_008529 [Siphonaria sp. JEL0065]|nr:hypothetical protein HDU68_008529 [Siphonaria sp. JEL0065]
MCPVAGEFDDLLKDLDASLDEMKTVTSLAVTKISVILTLPNVAIIRLKSSSKTAKDTWIEMIQTITPTAPKPDENELFDYLEDYADNNPSPRQQDLQAFKDHQRFRGVSINIARVLSVSRDMSSSTGSPVQTPFSPMSPQQFNWERRDSESTSFDEHRVTKWSAALGERYPAYPFESQPVGIPGGGIFGSALEPPDMARSRSNTGNKSPSSSYGADVKRKKSTSKAQMSKAFIQY